VRRIKFLRESRTFYILVILICLGLFLALLDQIQFIFIPLRAFFRSIFIPILIAVFIYYIFLPVYNIIKKKIKSDKIAIPLLFLIMILVAYFLISIVLPSLLEQIRSLITMTPYLVDTAVNWVEGLLVEYEITSSQIYQYLNDLDISIMDILTNVLDGITTGISSMISTTISTLVVLFIFPLILYYSYKEGEKFPKQILKFVPDKYKNVVSDVMAAFHFNAAQYIGGRVLICLFVAVASYLVFLLLGIPNALLFAIICGVFDIIPYFGPWIGAAPAFIIALTISPFTAIMVAFLIFVIQQLESYVFTPIVMSSSLEMHPVTVVLIVLFANELFGILGMILALPVYSIVKGGLEVVVAYYKGEESPYGKETEGIDSSSD